MSWVSAVAERLRLGLSRSQNLLRGGLAALVSSHAAVDASFLEGLEELLIAADVGPVVARRFTDRLRAEVERGHRGSPEEVRAAFREFLLETLAPAAQPLDLAHTPSVLFVLGVNGSGKTTTCGKLAAALKADGKAVLLAAADTFRAAAIEQLEAWGDRVGAEVIRQAPGADPGAVVFDALKAAMARRVDALIVDTAGRLHTKQPLMEELAKLTRVAAKQLPGAPHERLMVLDAPTGQNGLAQARLFHAHVGLTGIVLTKLDGTAKGGIVVRIYQELGLSIKLVGTGEGSEDLQPFDPEAFVAALLPE
ncbi:MAG: signal recognition particle-docking protein FtsY [Candidatus Rokubacteria bacterium]|nr:signal recognition particle-docking protein FtsY [Candidatus Rokubacteria bacterium]